MGSVLLLTLLRVLCIPPPLALITVIITQLYVQLSNNINSQHLMSTYYAASTMLNALILNPSSFNPHDNIMKGYYYCHLTEKETESQRVYPVTPKLRDQLIAESGLISKPPGPPPKPTQGDLVVAEPSKACSLGPNPGVKKLGVSIGK